MGSTYTSKLVVHNPEELVYMKLPFYLHQKHRLIIWACFMIASLCHHVMCYIALRLKLSCDRPDFLHYTPFTSDYIYHMLV